MHMNLLYAFTHHTGVRLAEVGFLFMAFAGIWFAAAATPNFRFAGGRSTIAGIALAIGAILLIIATHCSSAMMMADGKATVRESARTCSGARSWCVSTKTGQW